MYYAALIGTSVVINKALAGLWISDDAGGWWGMWKTEGTEHSLSSPTICPSNGYLFPYHVPYFDVNEDNGIKHSYSSGSLGDPTFSFKTFWCFQGALGALCWKFYWNICLHGSVAFNLLLFISFCLIYFFTFAYLLNLITPQIPMQTCCC